MTRLGKFEFQARCVIAIAFACPVGVAAAEVIEVRVGDDIQAAIDQASDGDIVQLSAGIHRPNSRLEIASKSIELRGHLDRDGSPATVIDGRILNQHLHITGSSDTSVSIARIELRFGQGNASESTGNGGSIALSGGRLSIQNATFRQNFVTPNGSSPKGGAIHCSQGTVLDCTDCRFLNNGKCCESFVWGGAVWGHEATITLGSCDFVGNFAGVGGAIHAEACQLMVHDCSFMSNGISMPNTGGGGAVLVYRSTVTISDTDFLGNTGEFGGALSLWDSNEVTAIRCRFIGNGSDECQWCRGGAVCLNNGSSTLHLEACEFAGNIASSQDIYALNSGEAADSFVYLKDCRFEDCCSIDSPRAIVDLGGNQISYNCDGCAGDIDCRRPWPSSPNATDASDLGLLLERWGTAHPAFDIDGDGTVGAGDLGILLSSWGPCHD